MDKEQRMPLVKAIEIALGNRPSPSVLYRWRTRGANGAKLVCQRVGKLWYTTLNDVENFIQAQQVNNDRSDDDSRSADMDARLKAAGLI